MVKLFHVIPLGWCCAVTAVWTAYIRVLGAALTGVLTRSPVYEAADVPRLRVRVPGAGVHLACDGEVAPAPGELLIDKLARGLVVYRGRH